MQTDLVFARDTCIHFGMVCVKYVLLFSASVPAGHLRFMLLNCFSTSVDYCSLLITFANSVDPDQA